VSEFENENPEPRISSRLQREYDVAPEPYEAPTPSNRDVQKSWAQMERAITSLINTQLSISNSLDNLSTTLQDFRASTNQRDALVDRARMHPDEPPPAAGLDPEEQIAASQQELERRRNEVVQQSVLRQQAESRITQARRRFESIQNPNEAFNFLESQGFLTGEGPLARSRVGNMKMADIQAALQARASTGPNTKTEENLINKLNLNLASHMEKEFARQAPTRAERILDAVEDAGIRQLRYGQLPLQDILRAAGTLAGRYYDRRKQQALEARERTARAVELGIEPNPVDVATASADATAPPTATGSSAMNAARHIGMAGLASRIARRTPFSRMRGTGAAAEEGSAGSFGGMSGRALSGIGAAARFLGPIGQAVSVLGLLSGLVGPRFRETTQMGQVTGEGFGAGLSARFSSFMLGTPLNPLDIMTGELAKQVVLGLREEGFRGDLGDALGHAVAGAINDLGLKPDSAIALFTDAIRRSGETIEQARQRFSSFDDQARALNMSINEYTQTYMRNLAALRTQGAGVAGPGIAQALIRATPRGYEDTDVYGQIFQASRGEIGTLLGGVPAQVVGSQRFAQQAYGPALEQVILRAINVVRPMAQQMANQSGHPTVTDNDIAAALSAYHPYFQGQDVNALTQVIARIHAGLGPAEQIRVQGALGAYHAARRPVTMTRIGDLSPSQLADRGITEKDTSIWHDLIHGTSDPRYFKGDQEVSSEQLARVRGDAPDDLVAQANRQLLRRMKPILDPKIYQSLREKFQRDPTADLGRAIENRLSQDTRQVGSSVSTGQVTIGLKPGMERYFQLVYERERALNNTDLNRNSP
jgi:hypothetical protein